MPRIKSTSLSQNSKSCAPLCCKSPCNEFLISHLLSLRNLEARGPSNNNQPYHMFQMYNRVIESVRKYPMPIICEEQLGMLAGIGDIMIKKMIIVIKEHYRKFLRTGGCENERINKKESGVNWNVEKLKWASECSDSKSEGAHHSEEHSEVRDKIALFPSSSKFISDVDEKSSKSDTWTNKAQIYKPRQGSQAANILKFMKNLNGENNSVTKKDLDKYALENNEGKIKQWKNTKETLIKNRYIEIDGSRSEEAYFLISKPESIVSSNEENSTQIQQQIISFKSKFDIKEHQDLSESHTRTQSFSTNPNQPFVSKKTIERKPNQRLIIIVDTREMKDQTEKTFFQETLSEKYKVDVMTHVLSIGDFAFCYDGEILDYVVERKKADDLAASIIDGRYKEQKYRLKNSGASHVIYLYEGYPSEGSALKEKELFNALLKTRVSDNFMVQKTVRINESVKFLASLYEQLEKRIESGEEVITIGSLEEYNKRNAKNRYLTVENIFAFGLKSFPNIGKQTVANILRYFKTYFALYEELNKYKNNAERTEFLNGLIKGGRTQAGITAMIVDFLFGIKEEAVNLEKLELKEQKQWWDDESLKKYQSQ